MINFPRDKALQQLIDNLVRWDEGLSYRHDSLAMTALIEVNIRMYHALAIPLLADLRVMKEPQESWYFLTPACVTDEKVEASGMNTKARFNPDHGNASIRMTASEAVWDINQAMFNRFLSPKHVAKNGYSHKLIFAPYLLLTDNRHSCEIDHPDADFSCHQSRTRSRFAFVDSVYLEHEMLER